MTEPILRVEHLHVSFPTATGRFLAVNDVSFALQPGELFGLVGESGSGKTTTAMAILRLLTPPGKIDSGSVHLEQTDLMKLRDNELRQVRWNQIALVPQGAMNSLNPVARIKEQLNDVIEDHEGRQPAKQLKERVIGLLESVGLPARVYDQYPHELSGGMKQRVCIAMAIALRPKLIIADEPTSALDVVVQRMVMETLQDVQRRLNVTLLMIGHDMGLQAQVADRIGIMYRGKLLEVGPVRAIYKNPQHPYTQALISSIPSIRRRRPVGDLAQSGSSGWTDVAPETIPALREVAPGHYVALP